MTAASSFPIVLSGPSGSGKTTVARELLSRRSDLFFSVSATTRRARSAESHGIDYLFLERSEFEELANGGGLLEWAEIHGDLYGTPLENLERARREEMHLLLDIDVEGARAVRSAVPEAVTIFLLPPLGGWLSRLHGRGSETKATLRRRLRTASAELEAAPEFEYVLVNEELGRTVGRVEAILEAEESRTARVGKELGRLVEALTEEVALEENGTSEPPNKGERHELDAGETR